MSPEKKLYLLAATDTALQADLGTSPFRWYDKQLVQGATIVSNGFPAVRFARISTAFYYEMAGRNPTDAPRLQLDVLHPIAETARSVADDIMVFLGAVNLFSPDQFSDPPTTPPQFPTYLLNRREGMDYRLQPPVMVVTLDVRIYNLEDF